MKKYILILFSVFAFAQSGLIARQNFAKKTGSINLLNGLFAYYPLDSNTNDLKNGYNGTGTAITYVAGGINNEASFNGTSSKISIPNQADFNFTDGTNDKPFTISFTYVQNPVSDATLFIISKNNTDFQWEVLLISRKISVILGRQSTGQNIRRDGLNMLTTGTRYKITITYDGSKSETGIKIYKNNVDESGATFPNASYTGMQSTTSEVTIGKWLPNAQYITGTLDDICFWNRVLTTDEITANYNRTINLL